MVHVSDLYDQDYPQLVAFVTNEMTKIPQKTKVYNAFLKYGEYDHFWEGNFLFKSWSDPEIQIEDLNTHSKNGDYIFAKYKTVFPRYIYVDVKWAKRFENDSKVPVMINNPKRLMEACILHEMCHRGDWRDGVEQEKEPGE